MISIEKLTEWVKDGQRSVDIEIKNRDYSGFTVKCFAMDYFYNFGKTITCIEDLPSKKEIINQRIETLKKEIAEMEE